MNKTKIQWPGLTHTWNPVTGCRRGCSYCYAKKINDRFKMGDFIPPKHRPKLVHWDKEKATNELFRLQKKFPDKRFILFEAVSECKRAGEGNEYHLIDCCE